MPSERAFGSSEQRRRDWGNARYGRAPGNKHLLPVRTALARQPSHCAFCDRKIRAGARIAQDFESRTWVHVGCYQRVNIAIKEANKEEDA